MDMISATPVRVPNHICVPTTSERPEAARHHLEGKQDYAATAAFFGGKRP
jgi:hypothetical protein